MKKIVLLMMGGLVILVAQGQRYDQEPYLKKTFPRAAVKQLEVETAGGNIAVYGSESGDARVEVYVWADHGHDLSKEEVQKRVADQYDLNISLEGDKLVASAKQRHGWDSWHKGVSISFRVYAPSAVSSRVHTSGGNIMMKDLAGNEHFQTSGGNLDVDHLSGTIVGRTSGGNVVVNNSHDDIDLSTSGGNMEAMQCEGKIQLETSGGNVELRGVKGNIRATTSGGQIGGGQITGELQAHTSGGNIGLRDVAASLSASTSGGNIDVNFLSTKYVDLSNSSGNISLQLPQGQGMDLRVTGEHVHSTAMNGFKGSVDDQHIDGTLNGGGIPVKVDGNGGDVHLSFK
jgi:hypothetical protein